MKAFRSSLQYFRKGPLTSQKPYCNFLEPNELPFLNTVWTQQSAVFQNPITLEGTCDLRNISSFIIKVQESEANKMSGLSRKEFIMVGRSNVGKSSLINSLTAQPIATTSNYPGKTRHLFFYDLGKSGLVLVDAPGYGFAKGDQKELLTWGKMIVKYLDESKYLYRVVCLIDAEHGFKETDFMLFELLESKQKPFLVCLTKCDKIHNKPIQEKFNDSIEKIKNFKFCSPIINATSSRSGFGIPELRAHLAFLLNVSSM